MGFASYAVETTASFESALDEAVRYYLGQVGPRAASRFLDGYAELCVVLGAFPCHGSPVGDSGLRWRSLGAFTAVYEIDEGLGCVRLMELHYSRSDWRSSKE